MNHCQYGNYSPPVYPALNTVGQSYKQAHPYVSLVICSSGVISNIINIIVLTKPTMRNSINCILTGIAVADIVTMTSYIPFTYQYYLMDPKISSSSRPWMTFLAVHMNTTLISHTSSIWLGVIMAAMRYFFVRPTARGAETLSLRSTLVFIMVTYLSAVLLIIPNCLATRIEPCYNNFTGLVNWHLKPPTFGGDDLLHTVTFFIYPVAGKIIPCTLISIFGGLLLHTLRETDKRARRLKGNNNNSGNGNAQTRRTTIMLLAIIALYIISELPQSILVLCCIFVKDFFADVYTPLSDFIDLLALINTSVNFFTYYTMSTQFRKTLKETFCTCTKSSPFKKCCGRNNNNARLSTKYSKAPPVPV